MTTRPFGDQAVGGRYTERVDPSRGRSIAKVALVGEAVPTHAWDAEFGQLGRSEDDSVDDSEEDSEDDSEDDSVDDTKDDSEDDSKDDSVQYYYPNIRETGHRDCRGH
eukprot:CAMPEP_0198208038 /NCGR_PEP_ID=MMETSP1445-20131203/11435_1 /TAXON_ID=36898 /ORGANISM="Pyramimonas sp., Strain CCMP2087" /LENGTH=107 /DNA_ID=CAMNT_0043881281 /DNA_START=462 /DNA_END=786 /DNA_ORIENTATION=-